MPSPLIPGPEYVDRYQLVDALYRELGRLSELDEFRWRQRKPRILLRRPYPPVHGSWIRSRQGGLPALPASLEWPYGVNYGQRMPMHFLAQIDCAEPPRIDSRLPHEGILFFFAVNMLEQIWDREQPHNSVRVYYAPHLPHDTPLRAPPADIQPMLGVDVADERPYWPDWRLPGEPGPVVHPAWPLLASRMDTWPDYESLDQEPPDVGDKFYKHRVAELRAGSVVAAGSVPTQNDREPTWKIPFQLMRTSGQRSSKRGCWE